MPSGGLSSPLLAPNGPQLIMKHSTAVLPVLILLSIVVLLVSSCDARGLPPVYGKVRSSSSNSKSHRLLPLPGKDVAATSLKADDGWLSRQLMEARHMMAQEADAKAKEGMKMAADAASSAGAVRATPRPAVTVSLPQRLSRREDTGFHLDYAGPRTHTPSHN